MSIESELKAALSRQPPREDLAPKVLARLRSAVPPAPAHRWRFALAIAIVLILAGAGMLRRQQLRQRQARDAARQLVAALHLASGELAMVRAKVVRTP